MILSRTQCSVCLSGTLACSLPLGAVLKAGEYTYTRVRDRVSEVVSVCWWWESESIHLLWESDSTRLQWENDLIQLQWETNSTRLHSQNDSIQLQWEKDSIAGRNEFDSIALTKWFNSIAVRKRFDSIIVIFALWKHANRLQSMLASWMSSRCVSWSLDLHHGSEFI